MNRVGVAMTNVIALALTLLTANVHAQPVTSAPDPGAPLAARWQWGLSQAQSTTDDFWIVYQIDFQVDERLSLNLSSHRHQYYEWNRLSGSEGYDWSDGNGAGWRNGASLAALLEGPVSHPLSHQESVMRSRSMLVLARYEQSGITHMRLLEENDVVDWQDMPVYWLGHSTDEESYSQVASMLSQEQPTLINSFLFRMLGLHAYSERDDLLQESLRDPNWKEQQASILEAIATRLRPALHAQLLALARDENAEEVVRRIAISALSRVSSVEVVDTLTALTGHLNPQPIRLEALESLAAFDAGFYRNDMPGIEYTAVFNNIVWADSNSRVRMQAIRCLASFGTPETNALLLKVAREHTDRDTRTQALEQLQRALL